MIATLEEISLNTLPAQKTFFYDGWVLRMSAGYSRRANSVQTYGAPTQPLDVKIAYCERLYRAHHLPVIFKMTPGSQPSELDEYLEKRGYRTEARTLVQTAPLATFTASTTRNVRIAEEWDEAWYDEYCRLNGTSPTQRETLQKMLQLIVPQTAFVSLVENGRILACGLGVLQEKFMGLFDIVVDADVRRRGYGKALVSALLCWGKENGAETAYLQVVANNSPALRLYAHLGFVEQYPYWYRVSI